MSKGLECQFDNFCNEIKQEGNLQKQSKTVYARMGQVSILQRFPKEKYREITPKKELIKEFEIKTRDLRIYLIKEDNHIIVFGGKKGAQKGDIARFRLIKKKYLQSKKKQS